MQGSRLRWLGDVEKRNNNAVGKKRLRLELPGEDDTKEDVHGCSQRGHKSGWCDPE